MKGQAAGGNDDLGDAARPALRQPRASSGWSCAGPRREPGMLQYPFSISIARRTGRSSRRRSRGFPGPGSNFVYADVDGNIGYHAAGQAAQAARLSRRSAGGWQLGQFRVGRLSFRSTNCRACTTRRAGMIVTANQNPFPADFPYPVNGNFAPPYRAEPDPRAALRAQGMARRGHAGGAEGRLFRLQPLPGAAGGGGIREAARAQSRLDAAVALLRVVERADGRTWRRPF